MSISKRPLRPTLVLALSLPLLVSCASTDSGPRAKPYPYDEQGSTYGDAEGGNRAVGGTGPQGRLEDKIGPGDIASVLTGTVAAKDRNLWINVPTASWYVREQDRKGHAVLFGTLAYDMVTVERDDVGQAVSHNSTSVGFLGIAGSLEERALDGTRGYRKHHWLFPFYRYRNVNGKRTAYALFVFPIQLADDPTPVGYDPISLAAPAGKPIDPEPVGERALGRVDAEPKLIRAPSGATPLPAGYSDRPAFRPGPVTPEPHPEAGKIPAHEEDKEQFERRYRVQPKDTLYQIATKFYGDGRKWTKLKTADGTPIHSPEDLKPGMVIIVPE